MPCSELLFCAVLGPIDRASLFIGCVCREIARKVERRKIAVVANGRLAAARTLVLIEEIQLLENTRAAETHMALRGVLVCTRVPLRHTISAASMPPAHVPSLIAFLC